MTILIRYIVTFLISCYIVNVVNCVTIIYKNKLYGIIHLALIVPFIVIAAFINTVIRSKSKNRLNSIISFILSPYKNIKTVIMLDQYVNSKGIFENKN